MRPLLECALMRFRARSANSESASKLVIQVRDTPAIKQAGPPGPPPSSSNLVSALSFNGVVRRKVSAGPAGPLNPSPQSVSTAASRSAGHRLGLETADVSCLDSTGSGTLEPNGLPAPRQSWAAAMRDGGAFAICGECRTDVSECLASSPPALKVSRCQTIFNSYPAVRCRMAG